MALKKRVGWGTRSYPPICKQNDPHGLPLREHTATTVITCSCTISLNDL